MRQKNISGMSVGAGHSGDSSWALREHDAESAGRIHWDFDDDRGKEREKTNACAVKRIFFCMHFEHRDCPQFIEG